MPYIARPAGGIGRVGIFMVFLPTPADSWWMGISSARLRILLRH